MVSWSVTASRRGGYLLLSNIMWQICFSLRLGSPDLPVLGLWFPDTHYLVQASQRQKEDRYCFLTSQSKQWRLGKSALHHRADEHPSQPSSLQPQSLGPSPQCCEWRMSSQALSITAASSPLIADVIAPEAAGLGRGEIAWLLGPMPFQKEDAGWASCQWASLTHVIPPSV